MKKFFTITFVALSLMVFTACGGDSNEENNQSDTPDRRR